MPNQSCANAADERRSEMEIAGWRTLWTAAQILRKFIELDEFLSLATESWNSTDNWKRNDEQG